MNFDLAELQNGLIPIAKEAGEAIMKIYDDQELFQNVDYKSDNSPLTLADQAAHTIICKRLEVLRPDIPILSEEGKAIPFETRKSWEAYWCVDPLDGTKEFIRRNGQFTVNIALMHNNHPVLGIVYIPVSAKSYYGAKDMGAWRQDAEGRVTSLQVDRFQWNQPSLRIVCSRAHQSEALQSYLEQFNAPETVPMGSSLKFMLLAEGKADVYPRLAPTMEWDTAAAHIIVEEAGGKIIRHETENTLAYNKENLLNPYFIAMGKKL